MIEFESYPYPLDTNHPYASTSHPHELEQHSGYSIQEGTMVKMTRGSLRGEVAKIAGCTPDGLYFVYKSLGQNSAPTPCGPFLRNEFEVL